jgi:hypothetical protein
MENLGWMTLAACVALAAACSEKKEREPPAEKAPAEEAPAKLDPYWEDASYIKISDDGPCPDGMWALFPGDPPGQDAAEKKANQARREALSKKLRDATFILKTNDIQVGEYDSRKGEIPLQVPGAFECTDSIGRVAVSFTDAKPELPPGRSFGQWYWAAPKQEFGRASKLSEASTFKRTYKIGLEARLVFKLGKVEVHKKIEKIEETPEERAERLKFDIPGGGGIEDWGAGRMVRAELAGVRIAADKSRTELFQKR